MKLLLAAINLMAGAWNMSAVAAPTGAPVWMSGTVAGMCFFAAGALVANTILTSHRAEALKP